MAFGLPSKEEIGGFLAAVYRIVIQLRAKILTPEEAAVTTPDMQTLKGAIEKLGVKV
ncbi:MAG: hypothetical protein ACRD20_02320 [Terriglobales bacterium]